MASVPTVAVAVPHWTTATETLATSGVVEGRTETTLGADAAGTLVALYVDENDAVRKGQLLGRVQNRVGEGQVAQSEAALARAKAQLQQARMGPSRDEIRASTFRVRQAEDGVLRAEANVERVRIAVLQSNAAVQSAASAIERAKANEAQATSRHVLARKTLEKTRYLVSEGAIAGVRLDEAQSAFEIASAGAADADAALSAAETAARDAQLARDSAILAIRQAESDLRSARAAVEAARADLGHLSNLPRPEAVAVAKSSVREAETALRSAQSVTRNAEIRAPFDGTVTDVLVRPGGVVASQGVLRLVETGRLEVKADVDESNLGRFRVGQRAILVTSADPDRQVKARVTRIDGYVEAARGTVQVVVVPDAPHMSLQPGQTVDVTIIVAERAKRLVVPTSAVRRRGDSTIVFVLDKDRARGREVRTGQSSKQEISILSGLSERDRVLRDAGTVEDGKRVRPRK
ncbi:MAG: efflux RND transporter periplasmic adaptor subunit [Fimbriimonas sp.]